MKTRRVSARGSGFAVVVAISLMGLMLVLTLGLSTMTQLELATASTQDQRQLARENARLGLLVALGELQQTAGPDQRITARAEILGDGNFAPENRHWTGIWDSTNLTAPPVWLVSGQPDVTVAINSIPLVKPTTSVIDGSVIAAVKAPVVAIKSANDIHTGNYAYWISGENDKISLGAVERFNNFDADDEIRRYEEFQCSIPDLNYLSHAGYVSQVDRFNLENEARINSDLKAAMSNGQYATIASDDQSPLFPEWQEDKFSHSTTAQAWSVLANPKRGGLKSNLMDESLVDPLANESTREYLSGYASPLQTATDGHQPESTAGTPYFSPRAIPTEIVLSMGIFHTFNDAKLRIRFHVEAEFWNPYTMPLIYPPDEEEVEYNRAFTIRFENLPKITVRQATRGRDAPTLTEDLNAFSAYPPSDYRRTINTWVDVSPVDTPNRPQLEPGEVYHVTEPNPDIQTEGLARDFGTQRWSGNQETRPPDNAIIEIKARHPNQGVNIIVEDYHSGEALYVIKNLDFDDFTIRKTFRKTSSNRASDSFSRPESLTYVKDDYTIAYHYRLDTDESDPGVLKALLDGLDLRHPELDAKSTFTDSKGTTHKVSDFISSASSNPADAAQFMNGTMSELDILHDKTTRSHDQHQKVLIYDVPRAESNFTSLGAMRYLPRWEKNSALLGSAHPDAENEIFDKYFIAAKDRKNPNQNYLNDIDVNSSPDLVEIDPALVASNAIVNGGFNINSTSVVAWTAFLGSRGLIRTASDTDEYARHLFTRLPFFTAQNPKFETDQTKLSTGQRMFPPVYQQGMRQLDPNRAQMQLTFIAQGIVDHLKTRGVPYNSVQSFLDSGALQGLLDAPESIEGGGINAQLLENSNVYITQADIAAQRADQLTARSDTFLIRSYGDARDPITGDITSEAYLEVMARRRPTKADQSDPLTTASVLNPREFEIVSWRWLDKSEVQ